MIACRPLPIVVGILISMASWAFAQSAPPLLPPANTTEIPTPAPEPESILPEPVIESVQPSTPTPPVANQPPPPPASSTNEIGNLVTSIVGSNIPHTFKDISQWDKKAERWDGVSVKREGFRIITKRKKKEVNHGSWKRYEGRLIDPMENFQIDVLNLRDLGEGRVGFDLDVSARVQVLGQYAKWVKGVQLVALTADTRSLVKLRLACEVSGRLDITRLPPDMVVDPHVKSAELTLVEFDIERIGKLDGPVVKELGSEAKGILQSKIEDYQPKLVTKINAEIDKNKSRFRISMADFLSSKWGGMAKYLDTPMPE